MAAQSGSEGERTAWKAVSPRVVLLAILALCVVLRGAGVLAVLHTNPHAVVQVDSASYLRPALALLNDAHFFQSSVDHQPEFVRTPGYPAFVALVYLLFGVSQTALLLAQVVVSTLTALIVCLLGARMWSIRVGLIAAALTVAEPLQWFSTGTILSESLATLLLVIIAGIGFVLFSQTRPSLWWSALLGLAIAGATMVRPVTYYLPVVVILLVIYKVVRQRTRLRDALALLAVFLLPLVVIVGGWQLRNHEQVNSWRFSGVEAKNLYLFRAGGIVAEDRGLSLNAAQHVLINRLGSSHGEGQGAYFARMYRQGLEIVVAHPVEAITGAAEGLLDEITSTRSRVFTYLGMKPASGVLEYAATAALVAFYGLFLYGFSRVVGARRDLVAHLFVVGVAVYVLLLSAGPEAIGGRGERFRAVVMPILTLYAAKGAYELLVRLRMRRGVSGTPG
jgi:4-amino-4-deoxy-L-arabinose transferase-like glycosyltransferase